jgi:hypothetical protein
MLYWVCLFLLRCVLAWDPDPEKLIPFPRPQHWIKQLTRVHEKFYHLKTFIFKKLHILKPVCDIGGANRHSGGPEWAAAGPGGPPGV